MLEVIDLVKRYGAYTAVDGLGLRVESGAILGLVGPNGAGKTTTLRCLAGIFPPSSGRILIDGFDLEAHGVEARRRLAFVPDEPHLFDHMTVDDHMAVTARIYGVTGAAERTAELLAMLDLADRRDRYPAELSRGMKQKLLIALALLHRPRVLILDEPLTGLDPAAVRRMKDLVATTAAGGAAIVISSHMLQLVEEVCNSILIIHRGKCVLSGTLAEVRAAVPELGEGAGLEAVFLHATGAAGLP